MTTSTVSSKLSSSRSFIPRCRPLRVVMASNSFLPCSRRRVVLMMSVTALVSLARMQQTRAFMLTPIAAADAALSRSRESTMRIARGAQDRAFSPESAVESSGRGRSACGGWGSRVTAAPRVGVPAVASSKGVMEDTVGYTVDAVVGKCDLEPLPPLKNRYYALRHGQSVANM